MAKKRRKKSGKQSSFDRHVFSVLVGAVLGASAFYAQRAFDSKSAAA